MDFIFIYLVLLMLQQKSIAAERAQSDALVLSAVLMQTVRREVDTLMARPDGWRGSPLVVLLDRTIPICPDKTGPWEECIERATLPVVGQSWWSPALSSAFVSRNARSTSTPTVKAPNVLSATHETAEGGRPFEQYPTAAGWVSVSLPGYTGSGEALVYVDFKCGAMCCHGWFVVLESTADVWRIRREVATRIC